MSKIALWVKTETPAIATAASAVLALALGLGAPLSTVQTGAIEAAVVAGLALFAGIFVRPFGLSALTGFVAAAVTLLAAFGIHVHGSSGPEFVSLVNAVITTLFALFVRSQTLPAAQYRARQRKMGEHVPAR